MAFYGGEAAASTRRHCTWEAGAVVSRSQLAPHLPISVPSPQRPSGAAAIPLRAQGSQGRQDSPLGKELISKGWRRCVCRPELCCLSSIPQELLPSARGIRTRAALKSMKPGALAFFQIMQLLRTGLELLQNRLRPVHFAQRRNISPPQLLSEEVRGAALSKRENCPVYSPVRRGSRLSWLSALVALQSVVAAFRPEERV